MAGMENLKVLVVHPVSSVRHMLLDVLKNRGMTDIQAVAGGEEAIHFLEVEHVDWLIAPFDLGENINTLKILNLLRSETSLRQLRVSLLYDPASENQYLSLAFALGLFSCHINNYVRDDLERSFDQIFFLDRLYSGEASLVSSFFLRLHLIETKNYQDLLKLDQTYLSLFPGSTFVLSNLVESLAYSGQKDLASSLARQIQLIDKRARAAIERGYPRQRYARGDVQRVVAIAQGNAAGHHCPCINRDDRITSPVHNRRTRGCRNA